MKRAPVLATLSILALIAPGGALAALTGGSVSNLSASSNIPYTQPTTVTLRWTVQRTPPRLDPGITVSSPSGTFTDASGTVVLRSVPTVLSKSRPPTSPDTTFTFNESVRIPRDVLFRADRQQIRTIVYRRDFTDCPGTTCSTISLSATFHLTGSTTTVLGVSEFDLRFDAGGLGAQIQEGEPLTARARLVVTGAGTLKGVWEVATPGSTAGTPFFQTLDLVTRQVSTGQTVVLVSPPLPSQQPGIHLVRFRLLEPELSEPDPALQYLVNPAPRSALPRFQTTAPRDGSAVDATTRFQWEPVARASSYRLEVARRGGAQGIPDSEPVTGILVKGADSQTQLTPSLLENLTAGRTYWWQVLAIDANGRVIGVSDWNRIVVR